MLPSAKVVDVHRLIKLLGRVYPWALRGVQLPIFLFAGFSAFLLRFDFAIPESVRPHLVAGLCAWAVCKAVTFYLLGLDRGWWRYVSVHDLLRLGAGNLAGSAVACIGLLWLAPPGFPRSIYILDLLLCFLMTSGIRMATRLFYEFSREQNRIAHKRTLIYGAGFAGVSLLREINQNPALAYEVIGFIDDSPTKKGTRIQGTRVFGNGDVLQSVVEEQNIDLLLIALPSATGAQMTAILQRCQAAGVAYKTVPGMAEVIESTGLASQIRDVAVEDILGRNPVHLDESEIRGKVEGKVVVVTGAAGSIGSELCRQLAKFHPAGIVGFESAESALFYIDREMRESFPGVPFYPEIGDIRNPQRLEEVFEQRRPSILYHAAAYKHVPMMEAHPFEAIENNVFGTWNVAAAAGRCGIGDFVMISSDKAVRPTNIMGASKRVSELAINSLGSGSVKYVAVRFGNVLGSNGSVIPIFKKQIAAGGPVTVTHPEMRRFFMTIPEAAQLVIQASTMGKGGEIFVLDMGEPVRIVDLARNLILLSGLRPDEDIKIEFTGPRPGEKLYEELSHLNEEAKPTPHAKIKIFAGNGHQNDNIQGRLDQLKEACSSRNLPGLILHLKDLVPDYNPSGDLLRRVISGESNEVPRQKTMSAAAQ